ncbi:DUF6879 family protein [Streptomyces nanshensis]|uniref:DUF6879 domain-containing protein n=1 Tax=Streptomyces nanshensis TaxID=518642 RepID=A0A1E7KXX7_9ACTN|nr:DUF6879 family protein [Streptomyces nanshensis]OEV08754.1 hypothetical protein AN218_25130 [Streptomyces nanshensis]
MPDLTPPPLPPGQGVTLEREDYRREFREREEEIRDRDSWKLERRQHFEEQGSASWDAMRRGEWETALRLLEENREALLATAREDARRRSFFHRVRVVEQSLSPYVQWQLHSLRLRAEYGETVRVVDAADLESAESAGVLPELVVLGGEVLYRVRYTGTGVPDGAVRYTDPRLVEEWERYLRRLHETGEDVQSYFTRRVEHLPPPVPA